MKVEGLEPRTHFAIALPAQFEETVFAAGIDMPISMEFAPDGNLFVLQQTGAIRRVTSAGVTQPTPFMSLNVNADVERGLMSIAFDPNYNTNRFFYVYYTPSSLGNKNRISRFTANATGTSASTSTETILLDNIPAPSGFHNGGGLRFGADGKLYCGIGDGFHTDPGVDLTAVQSLSSLAGKIVRLDPANYPNVIPSDNPFFNTAGARKEIYALGFRNPFSSALDPVTGKLFFNDVGNKQAEEVNHVIGGGNYGWPAAEGDSTNPNFIDPVNFYGHTGTDAAITGGAFYRGNDFPADYDGDYFFADYLRGFIRKLDFTGGGTPTWTTFATSANGPLDLDIGPDGSLYYLSAFTNSGAYSENTGTNRPIYKISFVGAANRAPQAIAQATTPTNGLKPLNVSFTASQSSDPDGDALTYVWDFGDGSPTVTGVNVSHVFDPPGGGIHEYNVTVTASDGKGGVNTSPPVKITVGNRAPVPTISLPASGFTYASGDTINFAGSATDPDSGAIGEANLEWAVVFHHQSHTHPFIFSMPGASGSFELPTGGEPDPVQFYRIHLFATDPDGLTGSTFVDVVPRTSTITLNTNVPGLKLDLDGQPTDAPLTFVGVENMARLLNAPATQIVNGKTYQFVSWSDGGAQSHIINTPVNDTTYTANYVEVPGNGLKGAYYDNINFTGKTLTRIDPTINFTWPSSPITGIGADTFSVRWTGQIFAPTSGTYTFYGTNDDGVRLWVNDVLVINRWTNSAPVENSGTIALTANTRYNIVYEFFENTGGATAQLRWSGPGIAKQIVPQSRLFSSGNTKVPVPFGGTPHAVPGVIEAENFDEGSDGVAYHDQTAGNEGVVHRSTGVDIQGTSDAGGGYNVGWTEPGEYLIYTINVAAAGTYAFDARVAALIGGGTFHIEIDGVAVPGAMTVPSTGDWQSYQTITKTGVALTSGEHVLKVVFDTTPAGFEFVGNFNWFRFTNGSSLPLAPSGLTATPVTPTQVNLSWIDNASNETGFRVERKTGAGGAWGQIAELTGTNVTSYSDSTAAPGTQYFYRVRAFNGSGNGAYGAEATATTPTSGPAQSPFGGTPVAVPANVIQAENYDVGGEGVAFHDLSSGNDGGAYRNGAGDAVDIEATGDTGGGFNVGYVAAGEWLEYTINVATNGTYTFDARVANPGAGAAFHIEIDGVDVSSAIPVPNTGGWQAWQTVSKTGISLTAGQHVLRVAMDTVAPASNAVGNFNWFKFTAASGPTAPEAPHDLVATAVSQTRIDLTWHDHASDETGFKIERKQGAGGAWAQIDTVGANVESYQNTTGLSAGTEYFYRVRATNSVAGLDSVYSNESSATTLAAPAAPAAPSALGATAVSQTQINLAWTDNATNETGFKIERKQGAGGAWGEIATVGANVTTYSNTTGLSAGTLYFYRVRATNGLDSAYSNEASATTQSAPTGQTPFFGSPFAIGNTPITIQFEDFDLGGQGVAYNDTTPTNQGGQYRTSEGVDISGTPDVGGGFRLSSVAAGEWVEYTVNVAENGTYTFEFRVSNADPGGSFHLEVDGTNVTGAVVVPDTNSFGTFATVAKTGIALTAGQHVFRVAMDTNSAAATPAVGGFNWMKVTKQGAPPTQTPFGGTPVAIGTTGGTIQAENYDVGGQGVAFNDTTAANQGGQYRTAAGESVDVEATGDSGGGFNVGYIAAGEWLEYTINATTSATFDLQVRVAAASQGGTFHVEIDGVNVTGAMTIPSTGGWQNWITLTKTGVSLTAGAHVVRIAFDSNGPGGFVGNVNWLKFVQPASQSVDFVNGLNALTSVSEGMTATVNGKMYLFGGFNTSLIATTRVDAYTTAGGWTHNFSGGTPFANMPEALTHCAMAVDGTKVWFVGGFVTDHHGNATNHTWVYDTATNGWTAGPNLPAARAAGGAGIVGRSLYFFGGLNQDRTADSGSTWALNLDNLGAGWVAKTAMPVPRNHLGSAVVNGKIYAIGGGLLQDEDQGNVATSHVYDPVANTWTAIADIPLARSHMGPSTLVINGKIVVIGGQGNGPTAPGPGVVLSDVRAYNPATNVWEAWSPIPEARRTAIAGFVDGKLVVSSGEGPAFGLDFSNKTFIGTLV